MKLDIVQPIRPLIAIIKLFGLWKLHTKFNLFYRIYTYILQFTTTILLTILMVASIVKAKSIKEFTESLFMGFTMVGLSVKVINIVNLNSLAVNFLNQLQGRGFRLRTAEELRIVKNSLRMFHGVAIMYTCAGFGDLLVAFGVVAFGQKWTLPYPTWFPFEYRYESRSYWMAYCYQFVAMTVACLSCGCLDMLHCYFLRTISLIYKVIGSRLAQIGSGCSDASSSLEVNQIFLEELKEIIYVHNFAKKLTEDCERLLSLPIFIQILLSAFVLCFTGYQLSSVTISDNPGRFIEMIVFLIVMALQIYLPCHYGNQITLEAGKLSGDLYNSNWTPLPQKSKKIINLYMEFLKQPVYVKAGHFFLIGIPTFTNTVNNAYSIFAVLIRMKK